MELSLLYTKLEGRKTFNEFFLFQTTCPNSAKGKGTNLCACVWSVTFQLPKGSTGASLLSLSTAVPTRGQHCRQALGTSNHQLTLHLKKHLDSFKTVRHSGQFVWLHKHNTALFQKARFHSPACPPALQSYLLCTQIIPKV